MDRKIVDTCSHTRSAHVYTPLILFSTFVLWLMFCLWFFLSIVLFVCLFCKILFVQRTRQHGHKCDINNVTEQNETREKILTHTHKRQHIHIKNQIFFFMKPQLCLRCTSFAVLQREYLAQKVTERRKSALFLEIHLLS